MRLDNAALIFPAISRTGWVNTFRLSVHLKDEVDPLILQQAVDELKDRFPSFYVRLSTGVFWYSLVEVKQTPKVQADYAYPLTHMSGRERRKCCFRVLYYRNRIAVEFFHVITDGSGGIAFLEALAGRYLELKEEVQIGEGAGVLTVRETPSAEETEDAFHKCSGKYAMSRKEPAAYHIRGSKDLTGFRHLITGVVQTDRLVQLAHSFGTTVNGLLCALMTKAVIGIQAEQVREARRKPVKITVAVNLRKVFSIDTLRNFALVLNIGVDPRLKDYTLEELCDEYNHQVALESKPEKMAARVAANVLPSTNLLLKLAPLPLKNLVLRIVYTFSGERNGCLNISNLGKVTLPEEMASHIERFDFVVGVQYSYPNNCSVVSFGNKTCINMIRNIFETELERRFFSSLVELGVPVSIESNEQGH